MNWLVIQSDGEHKGQDGWEPNWHFRECYAIQHAISSNGHKADIWGLRHGNFKNKPDFDSYDGVFTIENYELDWLPDLSGKGKPLRVYWLIDAHWQPITCFEKVIPQYDIVLHSTRRFIEPYSKRFPSQKHIYFPNGVDDRYFNIDLYKYMPHSIPIIFIGGKAAPRAAAIEQMQRECGLIYSYGVTGLAYISAILDAKMQFNKGLNGDQNFRNFETVSLGTCLLTEYDPELETLGFKHDVNCLFYKTVDEAVNLAKLYTGNGEWERVGNGGLKLAKKHSYTKRFDDLMKEILR